MQAVGERQAEPPPDRIRDLADGCVRFVEAAIGVRLDYEPETLPVLDHYLAEGRASVGVRPEATALLAHAAGAYFGEVVRRRYPSWWRIEGSDPGEYRIELEPVYVSFCPAQLVADALLRAADDVAAERFEVDEADQAQIAARLAQLPQVSEEEFLALTTRLEVLDIIVDAIRARRMAEGEEGDAVLRPDDYDL